MVFTTSDVYTTSGDVKLWNNWTQYVSKYDASSFYNWEQDNLPLYDIEERTYSNWEQHGFPTSCVPGLALVVSADCPAEALACNQNIFTTVSGAIEALPQHLRFPVLIEVASYKDLGDLKLHNIKIGYEGSLEIINRNFSKIYSTSADSVATDGTSLHGHGLVTFFGSTDVSATFAGNKVMSIDALVASAVNDPRFTEVNTVVGAPGKTSGDTDVMSCKLSVGIKSSNVFTSPGANRFNLDLYDKLATDTTIHTHDISATNQITESPVVRDRFPAGKDVVGMMYGNAFDQISVKNCDGPIYIRNFFADGEGVRDNPILIENSNVFLENCTAVRGLESGVKFVNSNSVISRGLVAFRNYALSGFAARVSPSHGAGLKLVNSEVELKHEKLPLDKYGRVNTAYDASAYPEDFFLNFSRNDYGIHLENSVLKGGVNTNIAPLSNPSYLQCEQNTMAGVLLENSTMDIDGLVDIYNNNYGIKSYDSTLKTNQISVEGNARIGYHGVNSNFIYNKDTVRIDNHTVTRGWGQRSQTEFLWNGQNIRLEGGSILEPVYVSGMPDKYGEFLCASSHGNMDSIIPNDNMDLKGQSPNIEILGGSVGRFVGLKGTRDSVFSNNDPGTDLTSYGDIVLVDGGSTGIFHGTSRHATVICGPQSAYVQYNKAGVCAKNNSTVKFSGPTIIGQYGVDVLATDNSVVTFGPPFRDDGAELKDYFDLGLDTKNHTNVELHATRACLVADNNSTINLEDMGDFSGVWANSPSFGAAAAGGYNYDSFSPMASACSAGSFQFYPNPADNNLGGAVTLSGTDNLATDLTELNINTKALLSDANAIATTASVNNGIKYNHILHNPLDAGFDNEAYSLGGMCVRVLNGSMINVRNVHFLTGYSHAPSGVIYDVSSGVNPGDSGKCDRLFIWNVDDTSEIKVELVSVSSLNPGEEAVMLAKGYHGPQAYWTSADQVGADPSAAFACPSSTPDTGAFSILDQYGRGDEAHLWVSALSGVDPYKTILAEVCGANVAGGFVDTALSAANFNYGYPSHKNLGPFRLYFAVDPAVNQLQVATSGYYQASSHAVFGHNALATGHIGPATQLMSQGYSLSGAASALSVSGDPWWDSLKQFTGDREPDTSSYVPTAWTVSGYYYTDEFVAPAFTRVFLDESASNMFANAKNAATGTSRRPKLVTIFDGRKVPQGDDMSVSTIHDGVGIHSLNNFDLNKRN